MPIELKSRAKRILTIPLPMSEQCPRFPATRGLVRRNKVVKHRAEPVPHMVEVSMPPVLTILPGQAIEVPDSFRKIGRIKRALKSRELIERKVVAKAPAPAPATSAAPTTKKRSRSRK